MPAPGRCRYAPQSLLFSWSSVLERDVGADRVHSLERIVEPIRSRFRIPATQHAVRFPEIESTEVNSCAGQSRPPCDRFRERIPDLQVLQSQVGGTERRQCRRLIIPEPDAAVTETRIWRVGAIFIPGVAVIEQRRVSPPGAPGDPGVAGPDQRPLPRALHEETPVEGLPVRTHIQTRRITRCGTSPIRKAHVWT